jgi:hypothetical protein
VLSYTTTGQDRLLTVGALGMVYVLDTTERR